MSGGIDIRYAGVVIGQATLKTISGDPFVAFADPLPVGTVAELLLPDGLRHFRVEQVIEHDPGAEPGMRVRYVEAGAAPAPQAALAEAETAPADDPGAQHRRTILFGVTAPTGETPGSGGDGSRGKKKKRR